jgi:hypothetical protein
VKIDERSYSPQMMKDFIAFYNSTTNNQEKQMILICRIEYINDEPKHYSPFHLSKTGLFGIIFLTACVVLTFVLCTGWFIVLYYRRFKHRRMKRKLRQALACSVQKMLDKSPITIFNSKEINNNYTDDEPMCAICLELFIDNEKIRKLGKII